MPTCESTIQKLPIPEGTTIFTRSLPDTCTAALLAVAMASSARAQLRFVNFNVAGLDGNLAALQDVFVGIRTDDKPGFAVAPHLLIFQEVQNADTSLPTPATSPLTTRINAAFPGVTYVRATYSTSGGEDSAAGAQCAYYRSDTLTEIGHIDLATGAGRNTDRWTFRLVGYTSAAATFYVYSSHLKASLGFEDERLVGVIIIRNNADVLPAGSHVIYAGDYNMYTSTEPAYQELIAAGNGQANDPYGNGDWTGGENALKHTQAPCNGTCALVGGGMDDRFDIQLATAAFVDGEGLARIAGMYRPLGNDGLHYNFSIIDPGVNGGNNSYYPADIPRSNALANDLKIASDHVPVICEYQVPAKMAGSLPGSLGRVIQNAVVTVPLQVSNTAAAMVLSGADELDFSATASGGLSGSGNGVVNALAAPAIRMFDVNTATIGPVSGSVNLTSSSQGVEPAALAFNTSGTVVRASNASLSPSADQNSATTFRIVPANTGVQSLPALSVFNFGYDGNQALLDVDSLNGASSPFQFTGGLANGIGGGSALLQFSIDTASAGSTLAIGAISIGVSDEDIPGAGSSSLSVTLEVRLRPILGDVDNDCDVDLADLTTVLGTFGTCGGAANFDRECDLDNSSCVDLGDLTTLLGDFGTTCP